MPKFRIATGTDNFRDLVTTSDVFIDKTLFIKDIIDAGEKAILITRPRRWGKSLALDMLKTFFAIETDASGNKVTTSSNRVLFEGGTLDLGFGSTKSLLKAKIAKEDIQYLTRQGQFPVIHFTLKDAKYKDYKEAESGLKAIISGAFQNFMYLSVSTKLFDHQKAKFNKFVNNPENITIEELKSGMKFLTELLYTHHVQKVYVLVDEVDKPVNYFLEQGLDKNIDERRHVAELVTSIMGACGKSNDYLEKIILTGIFDAFFKEGGSGFNNLQVFGIGDQKFATSFGFTQVEIETELLSKLILSPAQKVKIIQDIKEWYNGYRLPLPGQKYLEVYTAWAVMNHVSAVNDDYMAMPRDYWEKSGVNWVLEQLKIPPGTLEVLKHISDGTPAFLSTSSASLMTILSKSEDDIDPSLITYLLFNGGYLTLTEESKFRLPNREVHGHFRNTVLKRWICQELKTLGNDHSILPKSLSDTLHDKNKFLEILQKSIIAKVDGGDKSEAYFQAVVGGCIELYHLQNPDSYQVLAEKTVGSGRIDNIFYPPNSDKPVIIHEYKMVSKTAKPEVDAALEQSIWQILEKGYLAEPLSKKTSHPTYHVWQNIELRGLVFIKDENIGSWSVRASESFIFNCEEAERIQEFFGHPLVKQVLDLDNPRRDVSKVRQAFLSNYLNKMDTTLTDLKDKILDSTNPLLEDIKKKKIDDIKNIFSKKLGTNQDAVAQYIINNLDTDPKTLLDSIRQHWSDISLTQDEVSNIIGHGTKSKKARTENSSSTSHAGLISYKSEGLDFKSIIVTASFLGLRVLDKIPTGQILIIDSDAKGVNGDYNGAEVIYQNVQGLTKSCADNALYTAVKAKELGLDVFLLSKEHEEVYHLTVGIRDYQGEVKELVKAIDDMVLEDKNGLWGKYLERLVVKPMLYLGDSREAIIQDFFRLENDSTRIERLIDKILNSEYRKDFEGILSVLLIMQEQNIDNENYSIMVQEGFKALSSGWDMSSMIGSFMHKLENYVPSNEFIANHIASLYDYLVALQFVVGQVSGGAVPFRYPGKPEDGDNFDSYHLGSEDSDRGFSLLVGNLTNSSAEHQWY